MKYFAYLRVSTEVQTESGLGLSAQLDACRAYAERNGAKITDTFSDAGVSGAKGLEARPALLEAIDGLSKGDVILVAKRDRIGRDPIKVAMIEAAVNRKGGKIVSAAGEGTEGDDPASILMRRMIDSFAEYERLIIGARTSAALQSKKRKGERVGSVPYGYTLKSDGVHLMENAAEQKVIVEVKRLKESGISLRAIAARLESKGFKSRTGRGFAATQINRMLST